jgi:DNA-binding CsgD family transcriptional regulator
MHVRGYDADLVAERLLGFMAEFEPGELAAAASGRPRVDTEVLSLRRRERLSLYRELLRPHGVAVMVTAIWRDHNAGFGFHLARCGRGRQFRRHELQTLELLLPAIKLAESYVAARAIAAGRPATRSFDAWADQVGLTRAERRVAELVVRGLQNREIGTILGASSLTVRNQLGAVFRKVDVTNRAELAFVCASSQGDRSSLDERPTWSDFFRSPSHTR